MIRTEVPANQRARRSRLESTSPHLARLVCGPLGRRDGHGFGLPARSRSNFNLPSFTCSINCIRSSKTGQRLVVALEQNVVLLHARLGRRTLRLQGLDKQALVLGQLQLGLQGGRRTRGEQAQPVFALRGRVDDQYVQVVASIGTFGTASACAAPTTIAVGASSARAVRGRQQGRRGRRRYT